MKLGRRENHQFQGTSARSNAQMPQWCDQPSGKLVLHTLERLSSLSESVEKQDRTPEEIKTNGTYYKIFTVNSMFK